MITPLSLKPNSNERDTALAMTKQIIFSKSDIRYLIKRLQAVIKLINAKEPHMAVAKLLADISALKGMLQ